MDKVSQLCQRWREALAAVTLCANCTRWGAIRFVETVGVFDDFSLSVSATAHA
jgi:hypothetical protein